MCEKDKKCKEQKQKSKKKMWLFGLSLLVVVCTARCTEADVSVEAAFQGEWHEHGFFASSICLKMFMIAVQNSRETPLWTRVTTAEMLLKCHIRFRSVVGVG